MHMSGPLLILRLRWWEWYVKHMCYILFVLPSCWLLLIWYWHLKTGIKYLVSLSSGVIWRMGIDEVQLVIFSYTFSAVTLLVVGWAKGRASLIWRRRSRSTLPHAHWTVTLYSMHRTGRWVLPTGDGCWSTIDSSWPCLLSASFSTTDCRLLFVCHIWWRWTWCGNIFLPLRQSSREKYLYFWRYPNSLRTQCTECRITREKPACQKNSSIHAASLIQ